MDRDKGKKGKKSKSGKKKKKKKSGKKGKKKKEKDLTPDRYASDTRTSKLNCHPTIFSNVKYLCCKFLCISETSLNLLILI